MDNEILKSRVRKEDVPAVYSRVAPVYDLWGRLTESKALRRALELAAVRDGESVLEVAVGTGLCFQHLVRANPTGRNEGIDLTEAMLARARKKVGQLDAANVRLRIGDAYDLDFEDDTFDLLVNSYMFDLLPEADFAKVLTGFRSVLKPGGRLVMANMAGAFRWYQGLWERIYRINPAWLGGCRGINLVPVLQEVGFVDIQREEISQMTFPSEVIFGRKPDGEVG